MVGLIDRVHYGSRIAHRERVVVRRVFGSAVVGVLFVVGLAACGGGSSSSKSSFCDYVKKEASTLTDSSFFSNPGVASSALKQLEAKAPSEIKKDVQALAAYINAIASAGSDPSKLSSVANGFSSDQISSLSSAGDAVDKYARDNCGISLGSDKSSSSSKSSSGNPLSDLSSLSSFSGLSDLSSLTNLSSLSDYFSSLSSAFSNFSDLSDLSTALSDLSTH